MCLNADNGDPAQAASCQRAFGKPADSLVHYGASFGGPIKKNKLFFYSAWERYTFANYGIGGLSSTVPTSAFLNGRFQLPLESDGRSRDRHVAARTVYRGAILDPQTGDMHFRET